MFIHSAALALTVLASTFATIEDDEPQDSVEEPSSAVLASGTASCMVQGAQFIYQHDGAMSRFVKLKYNVRCPGDWSIIQRTSGREEVQCTISKEGDCSLTLADGDQIWWQVVGGTGGGNGVPWTLESR